MEMRRIGYFVRIAEDGSLTKAAGYLRIAQPALSRQIRLLEEELGVTLFSRTARGMQLTEEGEYLRASVAGPLRAVELALQNVRTFAAGVEGTVAIGMPSSVSDVLATHLSLQMSKDHPKIKLRLMEGITGSLIDWLNRGLIDFAVLEDAPTDNRLTTQPVHAERLLLVGAPDSDLQADRPITLRRLLRLPLILPTHHLGIRGLFNDAVTKLHVTPDIRVEADSFRLLKDLVQRGMGFGLLPRSYCQEELKDQRLRCAPITSPQLTLNTFLAWRTNHRVALSRTETLVIDAITRTIANQYVTDKSVRAIPRGR